MSSNNIEENRNNKLGITDIMKLFFSFVSIYLLIQSLFGKSHEVLTFYRSLFFLSFPIVFDVCDELLVLYKKYKNNESYKKSGFVIFAFTFFFSAICFSVSLIAQFANDELEGLYNHVKNNVNWEIGILFFGLYIVSFILYPLRNIVWPLIFHKNTIEVEKRPAHQN